MAVSQPKSPPSARTLGLLRKQSGRLDTVRTFSGRRLGLGSRSEAAFPWETISSSFIIATSRCVAKALRFEFAC